MTIPYVLRASSVPRASCPLARERPAPGQATPARGQDAHATTGETPTVRKQFVTMILQFSVTDDGKLKAEN